MRLASYVPGELIPLPLSGSIPELPHVAKLSLRRLKIRDSVGGQSVSGEQRMMGRREDGQGQFFYSFDLDKVVPPDHLVRQIDRLLDLSWVHNELRPFYSHTGRPSIDPVLTIRMLIVGYLFAHRVLQRNLGQIRHREVSAK